MIITMRGKSRKGIIHYVWIDNNHVISLITALQRRNLKVQKSQPHLRKISLVITLSPIYPLVYRLAGYKILHIHWMKGVFRPTRPTGKYADQFFYAWYKFFMYVAKLAGLKVVWTAHNYLPMEHLFQDNMAARKHLVAHCSAVIALSDPLALKIKTEMGGKNVVVIPAAEPVIVPTESRELTRSKLQVATNEKLFSAIGHLKPYKGPDIFLESILLQDSRNHFLVSGAGEEGNFLSQVKQLADKVKAAGHNLSSSFSFLSDEDLANLLQASDFLVCPFREISNSGFVNLALTSGTPMILPEWKSLEWVPKEAAFWYDPEGGPQALAEVIEHAAQIDDNQLEKMSQSGKKFMKSRSWDNYVSQHELLYLDLLAK